MSKPESGRRDFLKTMGLGATTLALPSAARSEGKWTSPNILFLFTDDQRFDAMGALGNPQVKTPNMDRLVERGTTLTHAHIMGSLCPAVCMPSRAMLMTGRSLFHLEEQGRSIPPEHALFPEVLRNSGYETFGTGKWHNGPAAYARCFSQGGSIFFGGMSDHLKVPVHDFDSTGKYEKDRRSIAKKFSSELFSDSAIDFIKKQTKDKPFFAYVSYTAPHDPRMAPKEYVEMYPPEEIELPPNFSAEHPFDNGELKIRDEMLAPFPRTPKIVREHIAAYYAMITHLDNQIGRVLSALEESGLADNTIIVFAGDNGLAVGQHGLLGKQNLYEHSVRVPLILCGPGIPAGEKCDALCYLSDVFPTLCEFTGNPVPESVEGLSLAPVINRKKKEIRENVFAGYRDWQRMVRDRRWKIIKYHVDGHRTTQLFDLEKDPWELENLADKPEHQDRVREMEELLRERMRDLDDTSDPDDFCGASRPD